LSVIFTDNLCNLASTSNQAALRAREEITKRKLNVEEN
jgi:hypothetical protein